MLKAIVFDFDGVIVDSEPLHYRAFLEVLKPVGVSFDYGTYMRDYIGYDDRDAMRAFSSEFGFAMDDAKMASMIEDKAEAFERIVHEGIEPFAGVAELIEAAAAAMPIAICSGALRADIQAILPAIAGGRLTSRFHAMVTADDVEHSKPDPQSYALAAERLGVAPGECLAIEDTPTGLQSARHAGLMTLAVANTYPADILTGHATRIVGSLEGLTVEQLREWYV
ncbi:MAG: HAD-IA family hydrolase [Phycisphaera sp.]|nr:HAD-IA family hydrolase [Phycisphaera sp.]